MANQNPQAIQEQLEAIEQGKNNHQQLIFDPRTGQLVVQSNSEAKPNPDAVVADQIARDGFFGRIVWIYL
jgi:hypothetical protein